MKPTRTLAALYRLAPRWADRIARTAIRWGAKGSEEYERYRLTVQEALLATGCCSDEVLRAVCERPADVLAEHLLFYSASQTHLASIQGEIGGVGLGALNAELGRSKGLILGCTHIGVFYHAILQASRLQHHLEILLVLGNLNYSPSLVDRLAELSGKRLRVVGATTSAAFAVARHLRRGGVVATMLDVYVESVLPMDVPFFGRLASTPAGIFQIAVSTQTPIAPIAVLESSHGERQTIVDSIVAPGSDPVDLTTRVNMRVEFLVRQHPGEWGAWDSLPQRWAAASHRPQELSGD